MVFCRKCKESMQDLTHQIRGLRGPTIHSDPVGQKTIDDLGRDVLQKLGHNVRASVFVFPSLGGFTPTLDPWRTRLQGFTNGPKKRSQTAEVVLERLVRSGHLQMFAERLKYYRQR